MILELDGNDQTITVDGVKISLELLRAIANPDSSRFYNMIRVGDVVTVEAFELHCPSFSHESTAN